MASAGVDPALLVAVSSAVGAETRSAIPGLVNTEMNAQLPSATSSLIDGNVTVQTSMLNYLIRFLDSPEYGNAC